MVADKGANIVEWRKRRMEEIKLLAKDLEPERLRWQRRLHPHVAKVIGHIHGPLLARLLKDIGHEDVEYMSTLERGRNVVGDIEATGIFPPEAKPASTTYQEWIANPRRRNLDMIAATRSSGDGDLDLAAFDKTMKEVDKGYATIVEVRGLDLDRCCLTPRFPKWELKDSGKWSVRNISDWKKSGGNAATSMVERYTPEDLNQAASLVRVLKEAFGAQTPLQGYRADYAMAFRQCPTAPEQAMFTMELFWDPHKRRARALKVYGQPFGGKGSQMNYVRDPAAMVAIGRSKLGLLISHYSDDSWAIEPEAVAASSHKTWLELNDLIGWQLDPDKSPPPAAAFNLLGALLEVRSAKPTARIEGIKRGALDDILARHLHDRSITAAEASSLRGKLGWARSLQFGRFGAAAMNPLRTRQREERSNLNPALQACLQWWRSALAADDGRPMLLDPKGKPFYITISDGEGSGNIGIALYKPRDSKFRPRATYGKLPAEWRDTWLQDKTTMINEVEAASAAVALATWPALADGLWLHAVDNTSAEATLVSGVSSVLGLNRISHYVWATARQRRLYLWATRVPTKDNPLDKLSRGVVEDIYSQGWVWDKIVFPKLDDPFQQN